MKREKVAASRTIVTLVPVIFVPAVLAGGVSGAFGALSGISECLTGEETWGGRKAHPAVVHSVMTPKDDPNVLSLRGTWDLVLRPAGNLRNTPWANCFTGLYDFWEGKTCPVRTVEVPSCWESQNLGEAVTQGRAWYCQWDASPLAIRGYHSGDGWYRKVVTLPDSWRGRRIWLKTGWVNSQGWFWVNGHQVALEHNFCATHKYDVTDIVRLGAENRVVVQVCNALPSLRGGANSKNHWGGILRELEFEATPSAAWIDDCWVRGDFDGKKATVEVEVEGSLQTDFRLRATVEGETCEIALPSSPSTSPSHFDLDLPLRNFRAWSPEHPNLYTARVDLVVGGAVVQTRYERFGVRKLEVRGREVFLNDKPFFLRGAGWHEMDPVNGYPKADRAVWLARARQVRAAGFNCVRNHTHCKMPEYFEACDEAGLLVEAELPYYGDVPSDGQRFDPLADADELYRHFRRHPSFAIYSFGNEGGFGPSLSKRLYEEVKARDPDRLVVGQDGMNGCHPTNYRGTSDFAGAPVNVSPRGNYRPEQPFFFHEYVNASVKLDSRTADGFTGVWAAPITRAARTAFLAKFGLDEAWGDRLQDGQNNMQRLYLKYGLEAARLDPFCSGYSYWSLADACSPQGGTSIGQALWDPFWREKRCGSKTSDVAVFNSASCVLMTDADDPQMYAAGSVRWGYSSGMFLDSTITNLVRTSGEKIRARFHLAHYGDEPLASARLDWCLVTDAGVLASGGQEIGDQPLGTVRPVAAADITVPPLAKPVRARLVARVSAGAFEVSNAWSYWLFPKRTVPDAAHVLCDAAYFAALSGRYRGIRKGADASIPAGVTHVIASYGSELEKAALGAGLHVVSLAGQTGAPNVRLGWWYMTEQMGAALADHPILAGLPHGGLFDPLFFRIGKTGLQLPVSGFAGDDFVMVGEGGKGCYLYLADANLPNGARRTLIAGLDVLSDTVEGTALLDGCLSHARSPVDATSSSRTMRTGSILAERDEDVASTVRRVHETSCPLSFWLGAAPAPLGLDGFLRWAYNSWEEDPYADLRHSVDEQRWASGATHFVYPDGTPAYRFLELVNGIQQAEKWWILLDENPSNPALADLARRYAIGNFKTAEAGHLKRLKADTLEVLNAE